MHRSDLWRIAGWLCIVAGLTLTVASFVIAATTPDLSPWPSLVTGFVTAVAGIVVLEGRG